MHQMKIGRVWATLNHEEGHGCGRWDIQFAFPSDIYLELA
jgi:hypothetical protein